MRTQLAKTLASALLLATAAAAQAQGPVGAQLEIKKAALLMELRTAKQSRGAVGTADVSVRSHQELFTLALAFAQPRGEAVARDQVKQLEAVRVDKQLGSGSSAAGSTTVAAKGAVPKVLAFAVENGALTKTQSGTTISFKANPIGLANALRAGLLPETGPLSRLALGVEFDASRGAVEGQPATFLANQQQLAAASAKYEILNHRDPASPQFQDRAQRLYGEARSNASTSTRAANQRLSQIEQGFVEQLTNAKGRHQAEFAKWQAGAVAALDAAIGDDALTKAFTEQLALLAPQLTLTAEERDELNQYVEAYDRLLNNRDAMLALAGKGSVLSVEYIHARPVAMPTTSTLNLAYETSAFDGKWDLTANLSASAFDGARSTVPTAHRLQEWAASAQVDFPLGSIIQGRTFVFTLAGRAEGKAIAPTYTRDTIWLGQAKLTVPVKDAGVKIPISVTVANRTDLINEKIVRGNVGLTFNLDSLSAK